MRRRPTFKAATSHEDNQKMNNGDVFISDSIILASIFVEQGDWIYVGYSLNYCAVPAEVP